MLNRARLRLQRKIIIHREGDNISGGGPKFVIFVQFWKVIAQSRVLGRSDAFNMQFCSKSSILRNYPTDPEISYERC